MSLFVIVSDMVFSLFYCSFQSLLLNTDLVDNKHLYQVKDTAPMEEGRGLLSERQVRVMQNLALIAPAGSPYGRMDA
jgi:hypothetical protein